MFFSQLTARVKKNKFWRCLWKVRSECVQRQLYEVIWQQRYFTKEDVPSKNKKITYMFLGIWDISHFLYVYKLELPQFQKPLWFSDIESCYLQKNITYRQKIISGPSGHWIELQTNIRGINSFCVTKNVLPSFFICPIESQSDIKCFVSIFNFSYWVGVNYSLIQTWIRITLNNIDNKKNQ